MRFPRIMYLRGWKHDPARRKRRFRCQACGKLVADGGSVILERRGQSSHGYHGECWRATVDTPISAAFAARARAIRDGQSQESLAVIMGQEAESDG